MVKAQQDSDSELAIIANKEEGRLGKQTLAVNTCISALQQQVETLRQRGRLSFNACKGSDAALPDRQKTAIYGRLAQESKSASFLPRIRAWGVRFSPHALVHYVACTTLG
ncbi:hypothetical protein [Pseudomonas izuensis]|uniref:hypothetical protein n=1 Tax=Pseudomonas izuensis TaxID=2684212 RepID=UPI0013581B5A|nr:hypothetical protein [Pseudomonas izuensis]